MERICFMLKVKEECIEEYKVRHAEVWPEMLDGFEGAVATDIWPAAEALLAAAYSYYERDALVDAQDALPNYVRNKVTQ